MGAEGARVTYPYLSGQWTEQEQYDDTFQYGYIYMQNYIYSYIYTCQDDYTNLFLQPEYIYICSGFSIYLPNMREKMYKKKEVMKKCQTC